MGRCVLGADFLGEVLTRFFWALLLALRRRRSCAVPFATGESFPRLPPLARLVGEPRAAEDSEKVAVRGEVFIVCHRGERGGEQCSIESSLASMLEATEICVSSQNLVPRG